MASARGIIRVSKTLLRLKFFDLSKNAVKATKKVTLDVLGCALAGSRAAGSHVQFPVISYKCKKI